MFQNFIDKVSDYPKDSIAIIFRNKNISYRDLLKGIDEDFEKVSALIPKYSTVVIFGDYSFKSITTFFALSKLKCIIVPILTSNKEEIKTKISICKAQYSIDCETSDVEKLITDKSDNPILKNISELDSAGLILFSSGSTGVPKAMLHNLDKLMEGYLTNKRKQLKFLIFLLFDHIGGLNTMLNIFTMGSTMVIPEFRTPESVSKSIQDYKVNILPTSPTFMNLMIINNVFDLYDFSSLKLITYGTEPMPQRILDEFRSRLPRTRLMQTFGTSETGIIKTSSKSSESLLIKFNDNDQETKIVKGELWIKSKTRILGYLNHPNDKFDKDGWFKTGDLVEIEDNGFLRIIGRKSQFINVGGEKVLPSEVENIIMKVKDVDSCTVFGIDNPITGQVVGAKIYILREIIDKHKIKKDVKNICRKYLERYKIPVKIIIRDELEFSSRFKKSIS